MLRRALLATAIVVLVGCRGSKKPAASPTTAVPTPTSSGSTTPANGSSTTIPIQTSGPRTVLSPIGLNLRAAPAKTAAVVGTAAQGVTLTVLSHTGDGGSGFYQVKGATQTGYITDNPVLSAEGKFSPYSSSQHNFSALYPDGWTQSELPPTSVVFHSGTGADSVVVTTAATASQLGRGRSGYRQDSSTVVVVCGVTGDLVTFSQSGTSSSPSTSRATSTSTTATSTSSASAGSTAPPGGTAPPGATAAQRYLVQVHLTLDAQHALGVDANLADLAQLQTVKDIVNSISFPFPQCEQGATPSDTPSTAPASTVP
ncbi:MAG: hypothetical protein QOJ52_2778 [Acidimicrobiaceae bacterium]|jgi:hypothetical protein|nr:hypothetical protein [Acidimicrobiaceae bacterium]MDQ1420816.1 hypothetical protein [Acidimicrobiaceae bacterium]